MVLKNVALAAFVYDTCGKCACTVHFEGGKHCLRNRLKLCKYDASPASNFASTMRSTPRTLQVRCGPASGFASMMRPTPRTLQVRCGPASDFASTVRPRVRLCKCAAVRPKFMIGRSALAKSEAWTASHLQSLRSEANKCGEAKPQRTCKVRSVLAKLYAVLGGNGN